MENASKVLRGVRRTPAATTGAPLRRAKRAAPAGTRVQAPKKRTSTPPSSPWACTGRSTTMATTPPAWRERKTPRAALARGMVPIPLARRQPWTRVSSSGGLSGSTMAWKEWRRP
jgi:hypothetical protein